MFFRFPLTLAGIPTAPSLSSASESANMKAWCVFRVVFSKYYFHRAQPLNAASKPATFIAPGLNSSPRGRFVAGS